MSSDQAAALVARFIEVGDAESVEFVRKSLATWRRHRGDVPLHRALRIGPTPSALERAERDAWLRTAAACLDGNEWERAKALDQSLKRFMSRTWPVWRRADLAPPHAPEIEQMLFYAAKAGAPIPNTAKQLRNIIAAGNERP